MRDITFGVRLADVRVPTVMLAGGLDRTSPQVISEDAFAAISSADKLFSALPSATHRRFDSTYCAQLRSAATLAHGNPRAILDLHTVRLIATAPSAGASGKAAHSCAARFFTPLVDALLRTLPDSEYPPAVVPGGVCATTSLPCTGLDTDEVTAGVSGVAAAFFEEALRPGRARFDRDLSPKRLVKALRMVGNARATGAFCAPRQREGCTS